MTITSLSFALVVAVALIVYHLIPRRIQNYWLLLVSLAFLLTWGWPNALLLPGLVVVNFVLAQEIEQGGRWRRLILYTAILLNVLALLVFRQLDFFLPQISSLMGSIGLGTSVAGLEFLTPIGLSFLVVQAISYQVDVHRKQLKASNDLVDFALYMLYFAKILAGPIERARSFLPKLTSSRAVDNELLANSFTLIVVGLFRKVVIADTLSSAIPARAFLKPSFYSAPQLWTWLLAYAFFLYNDFAGYTNIVRGVSGLFGIELSPNFRQPYFARNFTEFWNRWHITLSHWLRDYIYFPISRALLKRNPSRRNVPNLILPPMMTMLVSGLWHGTSINMLIWGGMHGVYQVLEKLPSLGQPVIPPDRMPRKRQIFMAGLVFGLTLLAWVPFRMPLAIALEYWRGLLNWSQIKPPDIRIFLILAPALWLDTVQYRGREETIFLRWPRLAQATLLAIALLVIFLTTRADTAAPFVYQGF